MNTRRKLLFAALLALSALTFATGSVAGGDVLAVIVNKGNPVGSLSQNELRPIF